MERSASPEGTRGKGRRMAMALSDRILELRTGMGLSQGDLADRLEVSRQSVSKWETGQSVPDLDKIIKLADLFGITVDELVREGERPQPPQPEPRIVYVERERRGLTGVQKAGVCMEIAGGVLALMGLAGMGLLAVLLGAALLILGLPLLLAKKHPFLIMGWLVAALSLVVLNPYISMAPWGLWGGLHYLYYYFFVPELSSFNFLLAGSIGVSRGILVLALAWGTFRAWRNSRKEKGRQ